MTDRQALDAFSTSQLIAELEHRAGSNDLAEFSNEDIIAALVRRAQLDPPTPPRSEHLPKRRRLNAWVDSWANYEYGNGGDRP